MWSNQTDLICEMGVSIKHALSYDKHPVYVFVKCVSNNGVFGMGFPKGNYVVLLEELCDASSSIHHACIWMVVVIREFLWTWNFSRVDFWALTAPLHKTFESHYLILSPQYITNLFFLFFLSLTSCKWWNLLSGLEGLIIEQSGTTSANS